jgi:hypothetical protein
MKKDFRGKPIKRRIYIASIPEERGCRKVSEIPCALHGKSANTGFYQTGISPDNLSKL